MKKVVKYYKDEWYYGQFKRDRLTGAIIGHPGIRGRSPRRTREQKAVQRSLLRKLQAALRMPQLGGDL